jgi:hypothetical protein
MSTSTPASHVTALLDRLSALALATKGTPDGEAFALLDTLARAACDLDLDTLEALPETHRLSLLARLQRQCPPAPGLAAIARKSNLSTQPETQPENASLPASQRLALALWSGQSADTLDLAALPAELQLETLETFITPAYPPTLATLESALTNAAQTPRDAAFIAWCERRRFPTTSPDVDHNDEEIEAEIAFFESLSPTARLVCATTILARMPCPRDVAESWVPLCEPGWATPRDNAGRALADARLAAIVGTAGDTASAEGLLFHASAGLDRENDPPLRAAIYRALFEAFAILATAPHGGPGPTPWFATVERLTRDRVTLRHRDAYFSARRAAIATLPRAALAGPHVADRGHESLRDLIRKLPEGWLELFHLATVSAVWSSHQRDPESHLSALGDALRKDGLPPVDPRVDLPTITSLLALAAPSRLAPLGDRLVQPMHRAWWWSTSVLSLQP